MNWESKSQEQPATGSLKTKLRLNRQTNQEYFHLMKDLPRPSPMTGSMDLLSHFDLGSVYNKYCGSSSKRAEIPESLQSYLPNIYGMLTVNGSNNDISSFRRLIDKPPICGKEIANMQGSAMESFKLTQGPVNEQLRQLFDTKPPMVYVPSTRDPRTGFIINKTSLEPLEINQTEIEEPERKRHKGDKKEKKKKKEKKNKKEKKDEERKHKKAGEGGGSNNNSMEF